jgi:nucleoside-diphosphate-sugar epimerase
MRAVYEAVIAESGSKSRVRSLPKGPAIAAMMLAHKLRVSPLGPYHYKMIAESFVFDTTKIKRELGWRPTLTNEEMLLKSYAYYAANREEIAGRKNVSTHRKPAAMGAIRLLKWLS